MSRVLVTGGTGVLGRELVQRLVRDGHDVRVLSRRANAEISDFAQLAPGDLETGRGIAAAVKGAEVIVHCATSHREAREVDVEGTRRLLLAARSHGSPHVVFVSRVGAEEDPLPYFEAKLEAEKLVRESGLPWSILRATPLHDSVFSMFERESWLPVMLVPKGFRLQPVDAKDVAARLAQIVESGPVGRAPDIGGPEVLGVEELARKYLEASNRRKPILGFPLPGAIGRAFREGAHVTLDHAEGAHDWAGFLSQRLPATDAPPEASAEKRPRDVRFS